MSTFVSTNTYTHSITYLADKMLLSMKDIVRESGLDPTKLTEEWDVLERGLTTWITTQYLESLHLEIFDPLNKGKLVCRWELDVFYNSQGDVSMWIDTDDLYYHIAKKTGRAPSRCDYDVIVTTKPGRPDVAGWSTCSFRSTEGMSRHAIGTMINASNGLGSRAAYWS